MIDLKDKDLAERLRDVAKGLSSDPGHKRLVRLLQVAALRIEDLSRQTRSGGMSEVECAVWGAAYAATLGADGSNQTAATKHENAKSWADEAVATLREGNAK